MNHHLVILKKVYLDRVLDGSKTTECRLSRDRRLPFGHVAVGDILWFKQSSGLVHAKAVAHHVEYFHPLGPSRLLALRARYERSLRADTPFFREHGHAQFATIVCFGRASYFAPFPIRKTNRQGWVVLPAPPTPKMLITARLCRRAAET